MRSIIIKLPFLKKKSDNIKIYPNENTLTFSMMATGLGTLDVVLVKNKYGNIITVNRKTMEDLQVRVENCDYFYIKRSGILGFGGKVLAILK